MKDTKEIQVFISCPGDLTPEKDMIIQICTKKNESLMQRGSRYRLRTLDFRSIIAAMSGRSQQEINDRFRDFNIYIGMLWMRFGTPSGAADPVTGKSFESGTEEEFVLARRRYEAGDKIDMFLFIKQARAAINKQEILQQLKVEEFREAVLPLGWVNTIAHPDPNQTFRDNIHHLLEEWISKVETAEHLSEKEIYLEKLPEPVVGEFKEVTKFITKAAHFESAVNRSLSSFTTVQNQIQGFAQEEGQSLIELVKNVKRVVVLGNAGSGKSTELGNLAHFYAREDTPFVPVHQRLNTFVDEEIEDFLPQGWKDIPQSICLIILDGLDEVQPANFNTLVRRILTFSEKYADLRMVVSCRTNLYSFPDAASGGTLSGFEVFFLEDIKIGNLDRYIERVYNSNALGFLKEINKHNMDDLIHQPFFLNMLLSEFAKRGNLDLRKTDLLDNFIASRIALDQTHYQLSVPLKEKEPYIIKLLQKVALSMEYLGRNFVSFSELTELLPDPADVMLIKFSTAFKNFETETDKWGFEHNNIQEYLAASALMYLNVQEIKAYVSIRDKKIKPSWLNTLFFLMGIIDGGKRQELIKWILEIDPEVLVKIEPDKIDPATRFQIFKSIFSHYKKQGVWLRSNKFSTGELARFVPADTGNPYLRKELNDNKNSRVVRLNALMVLKSQKLNAKLLEKTKASLLSFAKNHDQDVYIFHNVSNALAELGVADKETIESLFKVFEGRKNQYIRSGFYQMIISAGLVDKYLDYMIEGISFDKNEPDRDKVHLLDEDMLIKAAFSGPLTYESVVKLLRLFEDTRAGRLAMYHNKNDVLRSLVNKAISHYEDHPELFDIISGVYHKGNRPSDEGVSEILADFFHQTGTDLQLFKNIFENKELSDYDKGMLYKYVISKPAVDFVISQYDERNLTRKDVLDFYDSVRWFSGRIRKKEMFEYLTAELNTHTTLLKNRNEVDHQQIRLDETMKNTSLYFSVEDFRNTIKEFFDVLGIAELDWDTLWRHNSFDAHDGISLPEAAFDLLVEYTRDKNKVTLDRVLNGIADDDRFQDYLFRQLKEKIATNSDVVLSSEQQARLEAWVQDRTQSADIPDAIRVDQQNPDHFSYDRTIMVLWYFISKFKIKVDLQKLLDFTLYSEPMHNQELSLDFDLLEELAGKDKVMARVRRNLENGIVYYASWNNNALYALDNKIKEAYPLILKELGNPARSEYSRDYVLKKYSEVTHDYEGMAALFKKLGKDELRWSVAELLSSIPEQEKALIALLLGVLESDFENESQKFKAAKYLTKEGDPTGTAYYLQMLKKKAGTAYDFYHEASYLRAIKDSRFIPELIDLLTIANRPGMKADDFNRLDSYLADALYAIGLVSEENLTAIKKVIEKFIADNIGVIKDVNFYYPMIEKMEYHFWLAQSRQATIKEAIAEVKKLSYFMGS